MIAALSVMTVLKSSSTPLRAREIGLRCDPIRAHNTTIREISYLRHEYGPEIVLDDSGKGARDSKEKSYWYNRNYVLHNNHYENITEPNRQKLNEIIKSENTEIHFNLPEEEADMKRPIRADSLSFDEMLIISDFFVGHNKPVKTSAEEILAELVQYRVVTESYGNVHVEPFQNVPAKLMKKIDRIAINQLCEQEV